MTTASKLKKEHLILELSADDRFSAFTEIIQHLVNAKAIPIDKHQDILTQLTSREEQTTFAVGKTIAIPHINGTDLRQHVFAYARSSEGIEFGSCDGSLVHHIFLALIPEDKKSGWLKTLSGTAKVLSDLELRHALSDCDSEDDLFSTLLSSLHEIL